MWQALYDELKDKNFVVMTVALESRGAEGARLWIEHANPTYPCLIDVQHQVAALYNMVNVPQAVWIDERGLIVRPTETAGATEAFRKVNRETFKIPPEAAEQAKRTRELYLDAIRDWVANGARSAYVFDAVQAAQRTPRYLQSAAVANGWFRLAQHLMSKDRRGEALALLHKAAETNPDSWSIWRQSADLEEVGKSMGMEFWERVQALGNRRYYAPIDMPGMPE